VKPGKRGRARRFEQTAVPHLAAVYRIARQIGGKQTAEDLVQETYLRAWKYFETFDPTSNCRAWLLRILRNVWADRWRRHRLEIPLGEEESNVIEPYYDWEGQFLREELSEGVERALGELSVEHRWAVLLADVEELSYQEIAEVMACPIGTVMSRVNRGRRALARLLRASAKEAPPERRATPERSEEKE